MQNNILAQKTGDSAVDRAVERGLQARREVAAQEVRRLVGAAFALIARTGEIEPRVSEIVREAGLSNQAFYRHFRSKHELLVAVLDDGIATLSRYLAQRMAAADSPRGRVCEWLRGILEQALHPQGAEATRPFALARGRLGESFPEEVARSEQQITALARDAIAEAVLAGELPGADPDRDAGFLYHLAMGWTLARLGERGTPSREDAEALERFALAGLEGRGAPEGRGDPEGRGE